MLKKNKLLLMLFFVAMIFAFPALGWAAEIKTASATNTVAESAVLMDENGVVLFEKDAHKKLPPASVTKAMTLLLAVEAVEQGRVNLSDEIICTQHAWRQGGSQIWLEPGEKMTLNQLMVAIAVVSANDAAVAVMEHIYGNEQTAVEAMNIRAQNLGLKNTHFSNVNGLPALDHYMSAFDTAIIVKEAVQHNLYMELCNIKEYWLRDGKNWLVNTNKLLWWYPGADGLKTGWTQEAKYCFAGTAKRDGLRLIAVVFGSPEPRSHLRESMKLLDWGFGNYSAVAITQANMPIGKISINQGIEREIQLLAAQDLRIIIPKGKNKNIDKKIVVEPNVDAPIFAGQKLGELIVYKENQEMGRVNLVAEKSVEKAGVTHVILNVLSRLFSNKQ